MPRSNKLGARPEGAPYLTDPQAQTHLSEAAPVHTPNLAAGSAEPTEVITPEVVTLAPSRGPAASAVTVEPVTVEPVTVEPVEVEPVSVEEISADEADAARLRAHLSHSFAQHFGASAQDARSVVPVEPSEVEVLPQGDAPTVVATTAPRVATTTAPTVAGAVATAVAPAGAATVAPAVAAPGTGLAAVDPSQLLKELDVLKQVKDFNEQVAHEGVGPEDEADFGGYDELEADTESASDSELGSDFAGMHLVHDSGASSDYDDDAELSEYDEVESESGSGLAYAPRPTSSSRALVSRVRKSSSIGAFIRAANQVPLLSAQEEHELALRCRDHGDVEAARKLVMSHLRLVISVARGYAGYGLPLPDLIQEGNIGLMKALRHFNPDLGVRLAAFAVQWIKAEILDYVIRNWRMVKVATTKAQRKLFFILRKLKLRLGWFTEQERQEVAQILGVSSTDVAEMEKRLAGLDMSFDADSNDDSGSAAALPAPSSYLEDESSNFAQVLENSDYTDWQITKLREAMAALDERSRYILKRRWLDEGNKATLQELATELKVSIERVRQLETNARNKVKNILLQDGVVPEGSEQLALGHVAEKKKPRAKNAHSTKGSTKSSTKSTSRAVSVVQRTKTKSAATKSAATKGVKPATSASHKADLHSAHVVITPQDDAADVPNVSLKQVASSASSVTKAQSTKVARATKLGKGKKALPAAQTALPAPKSAAQA